MNRTVFCAVLVLLAGAALGAMVPFSSAELAAGADAIITGTVRSARSAWNQDRTAIHTDYAFEVSAAAKGNVGRDITVRVPGGEVDDIGMAVEDQPSFRVGDKLTLNLVRSGSVYLVLGGTQGIANPVDAPKGYSYSGYHRSPATCNYYVNSTLPSDWSNAIQAGDATWDAAGSAFRFYYQGTTGLSGGTYDGYNVVSRANLGSGGILAQNTYWYNRQTKIVYENDIVFNTYYPWSTNGAAGYYDVQNIDTHEMGHCLVLNDLYNNALREMTMYGYAAAGETKKRTLETGDKDGIKYIYGLGFDAGTKPATPARAVTE